MLLQEQAAVVTGASRGIGRAIALTLARHGASVVINGTREELLESLAGEIRQLGGNCIVCAGDVSNEKVASHVIEAAVGHFGKIDILVNNAGINNRSSTLEMGIDDWQKVMDVNLNSALYFCRAALPFMIERKYGKIVNVTSTTAKTPHRNAAPSYGASKAGVNYLTQHLALEMAKHNIYVNAICPGPIDTDMSQQWTEEYRREAIARIPLGKLGTPQNVADAVLFLASSMSDFITGESINLNGGTYMN
ncbi:3-oxoacyl-[acyl-carrier protein] reductase [Paenibacillus algorifonticola]|uniref:3-oxoacyl-[acyl-carrier protein] reductase n=1 Tax=Paenibacillus algorifonticola TaxID=684063 RepID=A0A1I1YMS1_9BACL|nr:SDR family NAD(P)-dependent oxidoreductase [Paenibacillus algorifonticola]SFE20904.1 3-oxoacyl-[acyl-carrier protein] reductase [Paenibacillus algorifonticola]